MPQHAERVGVTSTKGAVEDGEHGPVLRVRFSLKQGERVILVTKSLLEETDDAWKTWLAGKGRISVKDRAGEWLPYVNRASLIFKLLANADTDAIAAAATTSPPSPTRGRWDIGQLFLERCQAMVALGHEGDAAALIEWMEESSAERIRKSWPGWPSIGQSAW